MLDVVGHGGHWLVVVVVVDVVVDVVVGAVTMTDGGVDTVTDGPLRVTIISLLVLLVMVVSVS